MVTADLEIDIHHGEGGAREEDFIESEVGFPPAVGKRDRALEHQVIDDRVSSISQQRKLLLELVRGEIGEEAQSAEIDPEDRKLTAAELTAGSEDGPVTSEHDCDVGVQTIQIEIGRDRGCEDLGVRGRVEERFEFTPGFLHMLTLVASKNDQLKRVGHVVELRVGDQESNVVVA